MVINVKELCLILNFICHEMLFSDFRNQKHILYITKHLGFRDKIYRKQRRHLNSFLAMALSGRYVSPVDSLFFLICVQT